MGKALHAKEERRLLFGRREDAVDYPFLFLVLLLLMVKVGSELLFPEFWN